MKSFLEAEARLFWNIAGEYRHALADGAAQFEIDNLVDEISTFRKNTESDHIRRKCDELLALPVPGADARRRY